MFAFRVSVFIIDEKNYVYAYVNTVACGEAAPEAAPARRTRHCQQQSRQTLLMSTAMAKLMLPTVAGTYRCLWVLLLALPTLAERHCVYICKPPQNYVPFYVHQINLKSVSLSSVKDRFICQ